MKHRNRWIKVLCLLLAAVLMTGVVVAEASSKAASTGLTVSRTKLSVNVGFYTSGTPGGGLPVSRIRKILKEVKKFSNTVRFYGASGELEPAYKIAYDLKLKVVGTAWLSGNSTADKKEMNALISHCNKGYCRVACVGSETLLRGDLTRKQLINDIKYVRNRLKDKTIPVTTADDSNKLLNSKDVGAACDVLMINIYPYWGGVGVSKALDSFNASVEKVKKAYPGKKLIISETGWPTAGDTVGKAVAVPLAASKYFTAVRNWSVSKKIPVLWFDAVDEPWKSRSEGAAGAHWGLFDKNCKLKACYKKLAFFRNLGY